MMQTFTSNDLILHLYTEESQNEGMALEDLLLKSEQMAHNFDEFCLVKTALNSLSYDPSSMSIQSVLSYSVLSRFASSTP
jgi:hypothetical protein